MALRVTDLVSSLMAFLWFTSILLFRVSAQSNGIATFYTPPYKRQAFVMFVPTVKPPLVMDLKMIAATSEAIWNGGAACGQYYQVTCLSGTNLGDPMPCRGSASVVVKIVDRCPANACQGTIDLSQEAFASIADTNSRAININYQQV